MSEHFDREEHEKAMISEQLEKRVFRNIPNDNGFQKAITTDDEGYWTGVIYTNGHLIFRVNIEIIDTTEIIGESLDTMAPFHYGDDETLIAF
jgi:hypothetical protein